MRPVRCLVQIEGLAFYAAPCTVITVQCTGIVVILFVPLFGPRVAFLNDSCFLWSLHLTWDGSSPWRRNAAQMYSWHYVFCMCQLRLSAVCINNDANPLCLHSKIQANTWFNLAIWEIKIDTFYKKLKERIPVNVLWRVLEFEIYKKILQPNIHYFLQLNTDYQ